MLALFLLTLAGLEAGPHAVGVKVQDGVDYSRSWRSPTLWPARPNPQPFGVRTRLVVWYPAEPPAAAAPRLTHLDYVTFAEPGPQTPQLRERAAREHASLLQRWRHVGIVELTAEQARRTLDAPSIATRDTPPKPGKYPVVILGNPHYLRTTAEFLASHGYLVVSAGHLGDPRTERPHGRDAWNPELWVRALEWGLGQLAAEPLADLSRLAAIGHGGGGANAMFLAMRNTAVRAVAGIDAGIFSNRGSYRDLPFVTPTHLRVPMLTILTPDARRGQDLYEAEFPRFRYSERFEVLLKSDKVRHHDLSDFGRPVSAFLGIRGEAQEEVNAAYAATQTLLLRFLDRELKGNPRSRVSGDTPVYVVRRHPSVDPAPTAAELMEALRELPQGTVVAALKQALLEDPEAGLFRENELLAAANQARSEGFADAAAALLDMARQLYPASDQVKNAVSQR
ncbi:MAG: hypothetical protein SFV54_00540 [Bryobacteraceae bacterium]|nr:hypothetical protein [Bryobacteraceae bacterium]